MIRTNHFTAVVATLLGMACVSPSRLHGQASSSCVAAGPTSDVIKSILVKYTSAVGDGASKGRIALSLPEVPAADIQVVTDNTTCERAAQAVARDGNTTVAPVLVLSIGTTRFAVYDARGSAGEFELVHIYDSGFVLKKSMTM